MGNASDAGVPGAEGPGELAVGFGASATNEAREPKSGGAGLLDDILRAGKSILVTLLCCAKENWPSFVFNV